MIFSFLVLLYILVLIAGSVLSYVTIRHYWREAKEKKRSQNENQ